MLDKVKQEFKQDVRAQMSSADLISRQAVIESIKRNAYRHTYLDQIIDIIKDFPSAQPEQQWIPCSERLPRPYEQVLRTVKSFGWNCTPHTHVDIGTICPIDTDVIAWMPLPEPYREERIDE